jgi:outer membrane lipoprotein LolB
MYRTLLSRWYWWAIFVFVAGCAARPPLPERAAESVWLAHRASLESLTRWQVQGRVAVRNGEQGWNLNFDWRQQERDYQIRLRGPFGQGAVELHGNQYGVWLKRADRAAVFALDPETLLRRETGWRLPVAGLISWLRGLPVPGGEQRIQWDAEGRLLEIQQHGWQIDYRDYRLQGDLQLPAKLTLERDSIRVKFVIDAWMT